MGSWLGLLTETVFTFVPSGRDEVSNLPNKQEAAIICYIHLLHLNET